MAPSSVLQLASPTRSQLSRPEAPSMSVVHPPPDDMLEQPKTASPATSKPIATICFIVLLPSAIVDGVLIGGSRHGHVPFHGPVVGVLEALARIGLRRRVQQAPSLELARLEQPARLADEVMDERRRVLLDEIDRPRLRAEHLCERFAVEVVAGSFATRRMRLDQDAHAPLLRDADPGLHDARRGD